MVFIHWLWFMTGVAAILAIYNYIRMKQEEHDDYSLQDQ